MQYQGKLADLRAIVSKCGYVGKWRQGHLPDLYQFIARTGESLDWFPRTGVLRVAGENRFDFQNKLFAAIEEYLQPTAAELDETKKIFIVHGHDRNARDQLELILRRLSLDPFILMDSSGAGKTIVEALEQRINKESSFGIILMTPDDYGYSKRAGAGKKHDRARQNVIFEMGMVMAALGRDRMAILKKGDLEIPSDIHGIITMNFSDHVEECAAKLTQHLQDAGFEIDSINRRE